MSGSNPHGFRALGTTADPVQHVDRSGLATRLRRYRSIDGFEVFVSPELVERMLVVAQRAAPNEAFALVVGRLCEDARGRYVVLSGVVPDAEARATPVHVETTTEGERRMRAVARLVFPEAIVLGWMHTHPGHGAAYSPTDRRTQATWTEPHSIGVVVDWSDPAQIAVYRGPKSELLRRASDASEASVHGPARAVLPGRSFAFRRWRDRRAHAMPLRSRLRAIGAGVVVFVCIATAVVALETWRRLRALERRVDAAARSAARPVGSEFRRPPLAFGEASRAEACRPNEELAAASGPIVGPPRHEDTAPSHASK